MAGFTQVRQAANLIDMVCQRRCEGTDALRVLAEKLAEFVEALIQRGVRCRHSGRVGLLCSVDNTPRRLKPRQCIVTPRLCLLHCTTGLRRELLCCGLAVVMGGIPLLDQGRHGVTVR